MTVLVVHAVELAVYITTVGDASSESNTNQITFVCRSIWQRMGAVHWMSGRNISRNMICHLQGTLYVKKG